MYGGYTYNYELKAPAAWELVWWGKRGIDKLIEAMQANPASKNRSLCADILCGIASGMVDKTPIIREEYVAEIRDLIAADPTLQDYARSRLIELIVSFETDDEVLEFARLGFGHLSRDGAKSAKEMFAALSTRWLAINTPVLQQYQQLIESRSDNEPSFQAFFQSFPQVLDPMAIDVWPQPNLHGASIPDFLIRRSDNSYLVVEIETPAKQLITGGNQVSALANHAISQVAEYRRFLQRLPNGQSHFPEIDEISCLAVVGLERPLNEAQKQALRNDNFQRHGLRLVGFDWLSDRAIAIQQNMIKSGARIHSKRIV